MPIEVISSVNGLKYSDGNGYYFRLSQKLNNKLYLNCQVKSCRVRGNLLVDYSDNDVIKVRGRHNHTPDFFEAEYCEVERRILERSASEATSLKTILLQETNNVSPRTVSRLNYPGFIRRMQRRRQYNCHNVPKSLSDFASSMLCPEFAEMAKIDGQNFYINMFRDQAVLFLSPHSRKSLASDNQEYSIYQMKKTVHPDIIKYIVVICKIYNNVAFPVAYILMRMRTKDIYIDVFKSILAEEPRWSPSSICTCNEKELHNAILETFPSCKVSHSWFHYTQDLKKGIRMLHLVEMMHSNAEFFNCIEMLQALPLLPSEYMNAGYEIIKNRALSLASHSGVAELFQYIDESVSLQFSLFKKPSTLNMELKILDRQFTTSFQSTMKREAMWSFVRCLQTVEKKYSAAFQDTLLNGTTPKWTGHSSCRNQEKKILNVMDNFASGKLTIEAFFETIVKLSINTIDLINDDTLLLSDEETHENEAIVANVENEDGIEFDDFILEVDEQDILLNDKNLIVNYKKEEGKKVAEDGDLHPTTPVDSSSSTFCFTDTPKKIKLMFENTFSNFLPVSSCSSRVSHPCVVCTKKTYTYACQPCGHLCLCDTCSKDVINGSCPMCSKQILWVQHIILAYSL